MGRKLQKISDNTFCVLCGYFATVGLCCSFMIPIYIYETDWSIPKAVGIGIATSCGMAMGALFMGAGIKSNPTSS